MWLEMRRTVWHARMVEVAGFVVQHADALHDGDRATVVGNRKRNDLGKLEVAEAEAQQRRGRFGSIALAPMLRRKAPTDFGRFVGMTGGMITGDNPAKPIVSPVSTSSSAAKP